MLEVVSYDDFIASPFGRITLSEHYMAWCHTPTVCGSALWGHVDAESMLGYSRAIEFAVHPNMQPYRIVGDLGGFESVERDLFVIMATYIDSRRAYLDRMLMHQYIVLPRDPFVASAVRGFFDHIARPCTYIQDTTSGFLAIDAAPGLAEEVMRHRSVASNGTVVRLRHLFANVGTCFTLASAAKSLALSSRALQRALQVSGSSFREEIGSARLVAAKKRLENRDRKVADIAREIGYTSPQHFSTHFQKATGMTPGQWRSKS